VAQAPLSFEHADAKRRAEVAVVAQAVALDGLNLYFASSQLRAHEPMVLAAMQQNPLALGAAPEPLRVALGGDRATMAAAVGRNGRALQFASPALRRDKPLVLLAVAQDGYALEFAADVLRADKDVVLAAASGGGAGGGGGGAVRLFASARLLADGAVALAAMHPTERYVALAARAAASAERAAGGSNNQGS
jgi:hypothetical protein